MRLQPPFRARACAVALALLSCHLVASTARSTDAPVVAPPSGIPDREWLGFIRGGYLHQFDATVPSGGRYSVDRLFVEPGVGIGSARNGVAVALGYGFDAYHFEDTAGAPPWRDIHSARLSFPIRWAPTERWDLVFIPSLRLSVEDGGELSDSIFGGGIVGASYRFHERFRFGLGLGAFSEIEDGARLFPVVIVRWQITETLRLRTGRGIAATAGPGLAFEWKPHPSWALSFGGRFERERFRLDRNGPTPSGVGEDSGLSLLGSVTYTIHPLMKLAILAGVEVDGHLRLEDAQGRKIAEQDTDSSPSLGVSFRGRF